MNVIDIIAILSFIASGGLATLAQIVAQAYPGQSTTILNIAAIAAGVAGVVLRVLFNKTGAPATAVVADAPVVPPGTATVSAATPVIATNISSTSKLL